MSRSALAWGTLCAGCALIGLRVCLLSRRLVALEQQLLVLSQRSRPRSNAEAVRPRTASATKTPAHDVSAASSPQLCQCVSPDIIPPPAPIGVAILAVPPPQPKAVDVQMDSEDDDEDEKDEENSQACRLFDMLPPEALLRIFECLPHESAVVCERVCLEWMEVARGLPEWQSWLMRMARVTDTALSLPGAVLPAFGVASTTVTPEQASMATSARLRASRLAPHETCLAACGPCWTVLAMPTTTEDRGSFRGPVPLVQFSAHDFLLSANPASGLVYSGDKDGQLRVWGAHSGDLLARIPVAGAITSLEAAGDYVLLGDSSGQIRMVECAGLMEGEQRGVTWRAHEGKVTALHSRGSSENMLLSGGSDGTVRRWDLDKLPLDVSPRGQMRDLGLNVCEGAGEDNFVAQHDDSITQLAYYDQKVASASRDGVLMVWDLVSGEVLMHIPHYASISCLALFRNKLLVCSDDGEVATLHVWAVGTDDGVLVQQLGGLRKWNAPASIAYFGWDCAIWVRGSSMYTITWPRTATLAGGD